MRIRTQFIIIMILFGIILTVLAASAVITHQKLEKARRQENLAANIAQGTSELSYLSNDYLIYHENQQLKRWQSRFASLSSQVASLNVEKQEQQVLVRNIRANEQRLKQVFESVASAVGGPSPSRSMTLDLAFLQVSWSRMAVQTQGLVSDASRLSQLLDRQMDQITETRTALMYVMVGLFGALLLASYMLTYRRILKSIAKLQASTAVIGSGNLDFKIEEKQNDEIGDLSHAFYQMTSSLKEVTASRADLEREITERKKAEEELRKAHDHAAWLARFPEQNPNPVMRASCDGTVLYCNPASSKFPGWKYEVGQPLQNELLPLFGPAMAEGKELQWDVEIEGRIYFILIAPFPEERYANIYARDISARKRAEEALRQRTLELQQLNETLDQQVKERTEELEVANEALRVEIDEWMRADMALKESESNLRHLSMELLNAQEKERKAVAGEIHDSIGSSLAAIKFKVDNALTEVADKSPEATSTLESLRPIIQGAIDEARRIQMNLRPSILDDLGLLATIKWLCRQFESTYSDIHIRSNIKIEEHEVPDSLKTTIFRVLQEGLNNVAKHSKAKLAMLLLQKTDRVITLTIQDYGEGFDVPKAQSSADTAHGFGLRSMRERTELSGGTFEIKSTEGKGTTVRVTWPI